MRFHVPKTGGGVRFQGFFEVPVESTLRVYGESFGFHTISRPLSHVRRPQRLRSVIDITTGGAGGPDYSCRADLSITGPTPREASRQDQSQDSTGPWRWPLRTCASIFAGTSCCDHRTRGLLAGIIVTSSSNPSTVP